MGLFFLRVLQGILIGIGGVLPGVSGGVLCIAMGIYKPIMEVLASPVKGLKQHARMLLPIGLGSAIGFFLLVNVVEAVMSSYETIATCLFAGMILGTLPSLWRSAGKEPRTAKSAVSFTLTFILIFSLLTYLQYAKGFYVAPNFFWYFFAGAIWAGSIVLPGISTAAILLFLGLFDRIVQAAHTIDFSVLFPLALGGILTLLTTAKLINRLYEKHFSVMAHIILGIVAATTIPLIPLRYASLSAFAVEISALVLGFSVSFLFDRCSTILDKSK